jgi:twitching motility protein PilT
LDDAIFELLEKKKISAEDAYSNCYEKARFAKFLRHQPSDFTEI